MILKLLIANTSMRNAWKPYAVSYATVCQVRRVAPSITDVIMIITCVMEIARSTKEKVNDRTRKKC